MSTALRHAVEESRYCARGEKDKPPKEAVRDQQRRTSPSAVAPDDRVFVHAVPRRERPTATIMKRSGRRGLRTGRDHTVVAAADRSATPKSKARSGVRRVRSTLQLVHHLISIPFIDAESH